MTPSTALKHAARPGRRGKVLLTRQHPARPAHRPSQNGEPGA
jgi:hypothetical protein